MHAASVHHDPTAFAWTDRNWTGRQLAGGLIYELHVGTFTPEGTLDAAVERFPHLLELGITHVELLPVNAFNGEWNWGYDGVLWYAVHEQYGGPAAYQRFVDAAHAQRARRHPGRRLQPPGSERQLPAGVRAVPARRAAQHVGPERQPRRARGALVHRRERPDVAAGLPRGRPPPRCGARAARRRERCTSCRSSPRHPMPSPPQLGRPLTLIAESDLNDATLILPREADGYGLDRAVERRLPPRGARRGDGRDGGLLRRLRATVGAGEGVDQGVLPRRHLVVVPRARPRPPDRSAGADLAPRDLRSGSRPDRQPGGGRPAVADPGRPQPAARRRPHAAHPLHADAVHGGGVGGLDALAVLHLAPRALARHRHGRGSHRGVRAHGLGSQRSFPTRRTPRPSGDRS